MTTKRATVPGVDEIPHPRTIGEKVAAEYDVGYAGLGNRAIANMIDEGVKIALRDPVRCGRKPAA